MKKFIPHILGAIFVLIIIGAWMLIAHLVKKPNDKQVPFVVAHNYFVRNDVVITNMPMGDSSSRTECARQRCGVRMNR